MHLAGDYYRSQVNLQQQQQQQQQLEKPADMLAHDHYLGESIINYVPYRYLTGTAGTVVTDLPYQTVQDRTFFHYVLRNEGKKVIYATNLS